MALSILILSHTSEQTSNKCCSVVFTVKTKSLYSSYMISTPVAMDKLARPDH